MIDEADAQAWLDASAPRPARGVLVATTTGSRGRTSEFSPQDLIFADDFA
jgi:hypothetical protein